MVILIIIRIYMEFLVLFRMNCISALDCVSLKGKSLFRLVRNDLLMSSLNDFILKPLCDLEIMHLPISISFIFNDTS